MFGTDIFKVLKDPAGVFNKASDNMFKAASKIMHKLEVP